MEVCTFILTLTLARNNVGAPVSIPWDSVDSFWPESGHTRVETTERVFFVEEPSSFIVNQFLKNCPQGRIETPDE